MIKEKEERIIMDNGSKGIKYLKKGGKSKKKRDTWEVNFEEHIER
jgi:hypothetical protein